MNAQLAPGVVRAVEATSLYRHFAADGSLLYVGISLSWPARTRAHSHQSRWFDQVARVEIERFPSRTAALDAERDAIKRERPKFNVVHNRIPARFVAPRKPQPRSSDPLLAKIQGPHAIVGPALVYRGDTISVLVAHGEFGTAGELTELVLGELYPDLPTWGRLCGSVRSIRYIGQITMAEARDCRADIIRKLTAHLQEVQAFDTDLSLAAAYATQFPSQASREVLNQVAIECGARA